MSDCLIWSGTSPSRNASTSAAVISCAVVCAGAGTGCCAPSRFLIASSGAWATTPAIKNAINSNDVILLTSRLLSLVLDRIYKMYSGWTGFILKILKTSCQSCLPDLREYALEISTQNSLDIRVAVLASNQPFGQIKHALRMIEAFDVDLFAEGVRAFVAGAQLSIELRRHRIVAVEVDVTADTEMLRSDQFPDVIEVIQNVLDGRRFITLNKHPHTRNADDTAG